jgi:flagellar brake protein
MQDSTAKLDARAREEDERYFLTGYTEIVFALNDLIHRGELVTVSFNAGADFMLTTLLSVDRDDDTLVFDWGGSDAANRKLIKSERSIFVAKPDGIKVQFVVGEVIETVFGDRKAFVADLPEKLIRLQRREFFRVATPVGRPLMCQVSSAAGEQTDVPIHDLGVGGIGLTLHHALAVLEPGLVLPEIRVQLPDQGEVRCAATVCHATNLETLAAHPAIRVGLRLENPPHVMQARIQRYIVGVERTRRSMEPD